MANHRSERFVEIAVGHPGNRGIVIPLARLRDHVKNEPLFRSLYTFDQELPDHFAIRKTIKSFRGKYYLDRMVLDIDLQSDTPELCLRRTQRMVKKLVDEYGLEPENIVPMFSGRGYHLVIPNIWGLKPSNDLPQIVKQTVEKYFPSVDNIYDGARLIRVAYTPNEKTGYKLYKIPLTYDELFTLSPDEIMELSTQNRQIQTHPNLQMCKLLDPVIPNEPKQNSVKQATPSTSVISCVQNMFNAGPVEGSRHQVLLRMASSFRRHGVPIEGVKTMLKQWANTLNPLEVDRIVNDVFEKGYRYSCHDNLMDKYCDSACTYYRNKMKGGDMLVPVMSSTDMESLFIERIRNDYTSTAFDLNNIFDIGSSFMCMPGQLIIVAGNTGLGKTAWVQNICVNLDMHVLWLSLEMSPELMYRRFVQIALNKSKKEVIRHYQKNDNTWAKQINHIQLVSIPPKITSIHSLVTEVTPKINVLVVDTIDCIQTKSSYELMSKIDTIILELMNIAVQQNIIVIGVSHIAKSDARAPTLDVHAGKGSASIAQKADKVIGIEGKQTSTVRIIRSLKARDDQSFRIVCDMNPDTFRFVKANV